MCTFVSHYDLSIAYNETIYYMNVIQFVGISMYTNIEYIRCIISSIITMLNYIISIIASPVSLHYQYH